MGIRNYFAKYPLEYLASTSRRWEKPVASKTLLAVSYMAIARTISISNYLRMLRSNTRSPDANLNEKSLPPINLLFVVHHKDLELLSIAVRSAIHNSRNSIHKLFVITTDIALRREREILENLKQITKCEVEIINESEIVDKEIQERLKTKFGDRFGWVLQQLIIVEFVTSTRNKNYPCLQVDADTLIMNKQTWITNSNNQPLMESFERHSSYYIFLRKLGLKVPSNHLTFINHHMLFQPEYLRRIRENLKIEHVSELVDKIVRWADQNDISPICIEYELYAQGMLIFFPEKVKVIKSSNVGVARGAIIPTSIEEMWDKFKEYNSVSLHSYL